MHYLWKHNTDQIPGKGFFDCGIEQFKGWAKVPWAFGKKIERKLPSPLKYYTDSKLMPEDFPMTGGTQFLISEKIVNILKKLKTPDIDYYQSEIIRPNGEIIKGYYTINILNVLDCIDYKKSDIVKEIYGGFLEKKSFKRLILDPKKIPSGIILLRLLDREELVIAHKSIVDACEKAKVTGIDFIPVEEYRDLGLD